ncbi:MAG: DUF2336 domain-containing protein [Oceanicaulis sp.]
MIDDLAEPPRSIADPVLRAGEKALKLTHLCTLRRLPEGVRTEIDESLKTFLAAALASVRAKAASRLADCDWAPPETIRFLAFDDIEIARPVLERSLVLGGADLESLADLGREQRIALARRKTVPAGLTCAIARHREPDCLHILAANAGARLSEGAARDFAAVARADQALQDALAGRGDLSAGFARAIYAVAAETVRQTLRTRWPDLPADRIEDTVPDAAPRSGDLEAAELVASLARQGRLSAADLVTAAQKANMAFTDQAASRLSGVPVEDWRRALERSPVRATLLLSRSVALSAERAAALYAAMAEAGRGHALDPASLAKACEEVYAGFSRDDARRALHRLGAGGSIH